MDKSAFSALKILDMSRYLPGGYATQVFADLGAEVIKVEDVRMGDFCRHEEPLRNGMSYYFAALGRNKKSLSIDLKNDDALQAFYILVKDADVVVESFRPGVTKKLKINYDTLRDINPDLIYCSLTGYGQDDPRSLKPLHDINMQAQSGYLSLNGGVRSPLHLCDVATGMVSCQSILAALFDRTVSGMGRYIDISMFDSFVWWNSLIDSRWSFQGNSITDKSILYPDTCPFYNIYETKDGGKISVGLVEDKFWEQFCDLVGHPELKNRDDEGVYEKVKAIFKERTFEEWDEWIQDKNLCIASVIDKDAAIKQLLELEPHMVTYVDFPVTGETLQTNIPHAIRGLQPAICQFGAPPQLGENSRQVLRDAGLSDSEINLLVGSGAVLDN